MVANDIKSQVKVNFKDATKSDLAHFVYRAIEPFGRFQKIVISFLCINSAIVGINNTVQPFHIYTPENYTCAEEAFEVCVVPFKFKKYP